MQFKHPEILWVLFLLLVPILIHLFQLRRYKKTPFTNVAMLQEVVSESRKSNTLKKWLLLLTRIFLLAALITAFAQPFIASKTALQAKETVIYLDDSFSMQAKSNGLYLMEKSVQDLVKNLDEELVFSLFTNQRTFKNVTVKDVKNNLLSLPYTYKQLDLDEIHLKASTLFSNTNTTQKNLILISDFQGRTSQNNNSLDSLRNVHVVPVYPKSVQNVAIDSVSLQGELAEPSTLHVLLSGGTLEENLPISVYDGENLIAKTSVQFDANGKGNVSISIPSQQEINGKVQISDNGLGYDNQFFFNINEREKIKVLAIGEPDDNYLERLYPNDEFILTSTTLGQLDYSALDQQNVVVLDNLKSIPNSLQKVLRTFREEGGTILLVPSQEADLESYNQFLSSFFATRFLELVNAEERITSISFAHPLYQNVFEKEVYNFQYPNTKSYFSVQTRASKILSLEGGERFLCGSNGFYFFTAPLAKENSNFKSSPLIVPTFYNIAAFSLKTSNLYQLVGEPESIDIPITLGNDNILNLSKENYEFIPLQQNFPNKVRLTFGENPQSDGIFSISSRDQVLQNISFNYPRTESELTYLDMENVTNTVTQDSVSSLFEFLESENTITAYWKWFVILALLLALIEVIIQKFVT